MGAFSSSEASLHGSRSRSGALGSLSESSGPASRGGDTEEADAEELEFAILEAAVNAEVEAEATEAARQKHGLAEVCPVPPLPDPPLAAWYVPLVSCYARPPHLAP